MLCPKCGYITFDKLDSCPKCRKDWAGIAEKLSGTSSSINSLCFLGRVIGEGPEVKGKISPDVDRGEEVSIPDVADSLDNADFDMSLDELQAIDLSGIGHGDSEIKTEMHFDFDSSGVDVNRAQVEEDVFELTEKTTTPPLAHDLRDPQVIGLDSGRETGLDLNDIDLSDLVTEEGGRGLVAGGSESLDIDFSSFEIGNHSAGPENIDLGLTDDEESLNLSLELEPDIKTPASKKSESAIPDLGLSLDLDE